jgi:Fe-S-cluster-containing dehydrogenase component
MRVLSYDAELCTVCGVCEEVCSDTFFKEISAEKSKIRIYYDDEDAPRAEFCNQCGQCIDVCPTKALYRDRRGIVRLRPELCVGCLSCVGFCPYGVMFWHPDQLVPFKCIACGICARECPAEALQMVEVEEPLPFGQ